MSGHDDLRTLLGAYVLGGLDATGRQSLQAHLATCAECRAELATFAPLPKLLRRAQTAVGPASGPSPALLSGLLDEVRSDRRRRHRRAIFQAIAAAAAAAVVLVAGGVALHGRTGSGGTALHTAAGGATTGGAGFTAKPWGTEIRLDVDHLPPAGPFVLVAVGRHGQREQAATWSPTPSGQARLVGATSIPRADLLRVLIMVAPNRSTLATANP